jgi:myo-inositol-hexaphosphate 3-phosphohydrolase
MVLGKARGQYRILAIQTSEHFLYTSPIDNLRAYYSFMPIAKYSLAALDCPDPVALAFFYSKITDFEVVVAHNDKDGNPHWVELKENGQTRIAFQRIENYKPPTWPEGSIPQQAHLDFNVNDLNEAEGKLLAIGAVKSEIQPSSNPEENFRVYFDPAGHPFCLVSA